MVNNWLYSNLSARDPLYRGETRVQVSVRMRSALLLFVLLQLIRRSESSGNIDLQQKECPEGSDCGLGMSDSTALRALICLQSFKRRQNSLPRQGLTLYQLPPERNRWVGSWYLSHLRLTIARRTSSWRGSRRRTRREPPPTKQPSVQPSSGFIRRTCWVPPSSDSSNCLYQLYLKTNPNGLNEIISQRLDNQIDRNILVEGKVVFHKSSLRNRSGKIITNLFSWELRGHLHQLPVENPADIRISFITFLSSRHFEQYIVWRL